MTSILGENRTYWSGRASSYSEINRGELEDFHRESWKSVISSRIRAHFPSRSNHEIRILEVGTGPGFFAIILAEAGYRVTAIDLTPNMLSEAKRNAGQLASAIDFREMNAEQLTFPDESYDVVVSRNLTWNLPHPEQGYRQWCRVLKKGGLLLNFDANWYGYLFDDASRTAYEQDRENTADKGFRDQNIGENFDVMEDIARRIPLSAVHRPNWDKDVLEVLGMKVTLDTEVWQQVWSDAEKTAFASTPMFLVQAVRPSHTPETL